MATFRHSYAHAVDGLQYSDLGKMDTRPAGGRCPVPPKDASGAADRGRATRRNMVKAIVFSSPIRSGSRAATRPDSAKCQRQVADGR